MKEETKCYCGHTIYCDCGPEEPFKHKIEAIPAEEILANRSDAYEFIDFDKQETLEEAIDNYVYKTSNEKNLCEIIIKAIKFGAKWQQEQIIDFLHSEITERRDYSASKMCEKVIEFIEQFKNK